MVGRVDFGRKSWLHIGVVRYVELMKTQCCSFSHSFLDCRMQLPFLLTEHGHRESEQVHVCLAKIAATSCLLLHLFFSGVPVAIFTHEGFVSDERLAETYLEM